MPRGTIHHLTGTVHAVGYGYILNVDGGGRWRLDVSAERTVAPLCGCRVAVVGRRVEFDLLEVDTIYRSSPA